MFGEGGASGRYALDSAYAAGDDRQAHDVLAHPILARAPDGRVQCDVCPRACKLHEGQEGLCLVRARREGRIVLTTYGRSSGYCIDPIEKKPLNHFLPGTPVLSFGTAGCNLACKFCQNWDISKSREIDTLADQAAPDAIAEAAVRLGCRSVAYTYNDPVIFMEYAIDVARACRARGVKSVAVTAGYICPSRAGTVSPHGRRQRGPQGLHRAFLSQGLRRPSHARPRHPVLSQAQTEVWFEITTLLIPGENDTDEELDAMTRWVVEHLGPEVPLHFTAFHPDWKMRDTPHTPTTTLTRARRIALGNGVRYAYTGNVHDAAGASTYCHACGAVLVGRDWYVLSDWNLCADGRCSSCGTPCAGVFEQRPGQWGPKRVPVRLRDSLH